MATEYEELSEAIKERFPNAKFEISMFDTIEEIETKELTDEDMILYADNANFHLTDKTCFKLILVKKQEGQTHIRYCDVIDAMIENKFKHTERRYMESIEKYGEQSGPCSLSIYTSFWGS